MAKLLSSIGWTQERIAVEFARIASALREDGDAVSIEDIEKLVKDCRTCYGNSLISENGPVPGRGSHDEHVDVLIVGIMPGYTEEQTGKVFSGPNSQILLTAMHEAGIGTDECTVYATNLVCCVPQGKTPRVAQVTNCSPFLAKTIDTLSPHVVVALGSEVLSYFMGKQTRIGDHEGEVMLLGRIVLVPIRHPSAVHRIPDPSSKELAMTEYKQLISGIRRVSDRIKLLQSEGKNPLKGDLGVSIYSEGATKDEGQQSLL